MRKIPLSVLGAQLPVGTILPGADRARSFAFKPWRTSDELTLGKLRDSQRAMPAGEFASHVLAHFMTEWCGQPVAQLQPHERRLIASRSWAGDFYAAWFALRQAALGNDLEMRIVCQLCRSGFEYVVDLGSVECEVPDDGEDLRQPIQLRDGLEYRGSLRKLLTLSPLRWSAYESLGDEGLNMGALKASLVAASIVGIEGVEGDVRVSPTELDLTKFDFERLVDRVNHHQPGPSLSIETACPKCSAPVTRSIPWTFDSFFSGRGSGRGGPSTP